MAWKQDLAKLKQQLDPEPPSAARKPLPKPVPKPGGPAALDDEDAVFLSAMGMRPAPPRVAKSPASAGATPVPAASDPAAPGTFQEALHGLKGLKPLEKSPLEQATPPMEPPKPAPVAVPVQLPAPAPPEDPAGWCRPRWPGTRG